MTTRPIDRYPDVDLDEILTSLLDSYHREIRTSGDYAVSTKGAMRSHTKSFVRWCTTGELGRPVGRPWPNDEG